jgi:hypothetical protein
MYGARSIAHGVDNLICNLDLKLLRSALCAILCAICLEAVTSDRKPETRSLTPETFFLPDQNQTNLRKNDYQD